MVWFLLETKKSKQNHLFLPRFFKKKKIKNKNVAMDRLLENGNNKCLEFADVRVKDAISCGRLSGLSIADLCGELDMGRFQGGKAEFV